MMWQPNRSLGQLTVPQQDIARMEFLDSDDLDAEAAQQHEDRIADYTPDPWWAPAGALTARSPREAVPPARGTGVHHGSDLVPGDQPTADASERRVAARVQASRAEETSRVGWRATPTTSR